MHWIEVRSTFERDLPDLSPFIEIYREHGIENTLEERTTLSGCLVDVDGSAARIELLRAALMDAGARDVETRELPEDNWEEAWKAFFKPRRVGRRFVIRPTWEEFSSCPGDRVIVLDPGQAFGTGDHPTTRMCLELLENSHPEGKRMLDVGCGSGILAIGGCLLGAGVVEATDIDPLAVEVTKHNAQMNGVYLRAFSGEGLGALVGIPGKATTDVEHDETRLGPEAAAGAVHLQHPGLTRELGPYDIVVSNIISATLIRLSPDIFHVLKPGGLWIVSGIIQANWPDVRFASESHGFELVEKREEDGWVAAGFMRF